MPAEPSGCLGFLFRAFSQSPSAGTLAPPRVMVNNKFISYAEQDFMRVLLRVVGNRGHVLAEVSLKQLLYLPGNNRSNPDRASWQNKIDKRSIDFVICDPKTFRPLVAIELDDASHGHEKRKIRDEEVRVVLEAAGLAFVRQPCRRAYDMRELSVLLEPHLSPQS